MKAFFNILIILTALLFLGCSGSKSIVKPGENEQPKVSFKAREYYLKGLYLQMEERFSEALVQFHKAQIFDTSSATIHNSLAENYIKLNEFEPALYHLKKAHRIDSLNFETLQLKAEVFLRQRNDAQAIATYEKIVHFDPYNDNARSLLFLLYDKTNQPLRKASLYKDMLDLYGPNKTILDKIYEVYEKEKEYEQALDYINQIIALDSTDAEYYSKKGLILQNLKRSDEAIQSFKKAHHLAPDDFETLRQLAVAYYLEGSFKECADLLSGRLGDEPEGNTLFNLLVDAWYKLKAYDNVTDFFTNRLQTTPDDNTARVILADAWYMQENYDKTVEVLTPIENDADNGWRVYDLLGRVALERENFETALRNFRRIVEMDNKNRFGWLFLGFTYNDMNNSDSAIITFKEALNYLPEDATIWSWLGITLQQQDKLSEAIEPFLKAINIDPRNTNALTSLPVVFEELDMFSQADSIYELGLENLPDNALLLNNFAYSLSERDMRLNEALEMAQKAIDMEPENGAYLDTIGWIYYKLKQYRRAEEFIVKSLQIRPNSAVVLEHLGDVYFKLDNIAEAKKYWKKSIEIQPDNQTVLDKIANH